MFECNCKLETLAAAQLIRRMLNNGAGIDEIGRATSYMVTAAEYDAATVKLDEVAERTGIKELAKKYTNPSSGRYPWEDGPNPSLERTIKKMINRCFGLPNPEFDLSSIKVGDKIVVSLKELGVFEATAHEVNDSNILFIFDDYITERPMNENNSNVGGYEESDLKKWIENDLFNKFPVGLQVRLRDLTIPTVGQVIGWGDEWDKDHFEADGDEQLPLMKLIKNRVAYFNNEYKWGWFRNATKKEYSSADFAIVDSYGHANSISASHSIGVRPEFRLVKPEGFLKNNEEGSNGNNL